MDNNSAWAQLHWLPVTKDDLMLDRLASENDAEPLMGSLGETCLLLTGRLTTLDALHLGGGSIFFLLELII